MIKFSELVREVNAVINDVMFLIEHREKETYFTRSSAKLSFPELICFVLNLPKASLQTEVNRFLNMFAPDKTMSKTSVNEARLKISSNAFTAINDFIAGKFYEDGDYKTYKGYRLIAVDGSVFDVNAGAAESFGVMETVGNPVVKAQTVALVDVLNDIVIDAVMGAYKESERLLAMEAIEVLRQKADFRDLYIFDRGFPSREIIGELYEQGAHFLMRTSSRFLKAVNSANDKDQTVRITDPNGKQRELRVVNVILPTGANEKLITNVFDLSPDELKEIYGLRWGIETKYLELKERLQIENFTGSRLELILQDFYATLVIVNLVSLAKWEAQALNNSLPPKKRLKYEYKINTNIAIATLRDILIHALLEHDNKRYKMIIARALLTIRKNTIPIRTERPSEPRVRKNLSQKFPLNKKSGW